MWSAAASSRHGCCLRAWFSFLAVTSADRRSRVSRALLTEVARRAHEAGHTFLALVAQDDGDSDGQLAFCWACGLKPCGPDQQGATWGCPVSEILAGSVPGAEAR